MKKRMSIALAAGLLVMSLTGCGENQIPDMTDEQMQEIGEFTAITLMKYDAGNRSRLVDISLLGLPDPTPEPTPEPTPTPTPSGMDPVDDTPVISGGTGNGSSATMEEVLELTEGLSVVYMGEELHKTYFEDEDENSSLSMTAAEGKQILVLNFSIMNTSDQEQSVDFLSMAPEFRITVNGTYTRRALMTGFKNDMPLYKGVIPAMQGVPLAILIEVEDADAANLSSISLNVKNASNSCTIQLL